MERRWSKRLTIQWSALITDRNHQPVLAQVENVGLEGMFLHIRNAWVRLDGLVEVKILIPQATRGIEIYHVSGYVIHETVRGVGLMLVHFNRSLYQHIELLLTTPEPLTGRSALLHDATGRVDHMRVKDSPAGAGSKWPQAPTMISDLPRWHDPADTLVGPPGGRVRHLHKD